MMRMIAWVSVIATLGFFALFAALTYAIAVNLFARVASSAPPDPNRLVLHLTAAVLLGALGMYTLLHPEKLLEQTIENNRRLRRVPVLGWFWGGWIDDDLARSDLSRWTMRVGGIVELGCALMMIGLMWN